jgi:phosphoribosylformimino-5-aminoimidazole carboxamide ribotide isomerase
MILFPAIDLKDGKCVRLLRGDMQRATVFNDSPAAQAKAFANAGCEWLHLVDLNGAVEGHPVNRAAVESILKDVDVPTQLGGGIRTIESIAQWFEAGVKRVILGTKAISDPNFLRSAVNKYGDRIVVGLDCKDGYVCTTGWTQTSNLYYTEFARVLERLGVKTIIFTDISRDGTLSGPNLEMLDHLKKAVNLDIVASGGVRDLGNIESLKNLGLYGAVTGKSLYAGTLDLEEALKTAKDAE